jgi:hypothetical protein
MGQRLNICYSFAGIYSIMVPEGRREPGISYLLINATLKKDVTDSDGSDLWKSISLEPIDYPGDSVALQLTLCMTASEAQDLEIDATRPIPVPPEPVLTWDTSTATFHAGEVLSQLGTGTSTNRGLFALAPRSWK